MNEFDLNKLKDFALSKEKSMPHVMPFIIPLAKKMIDSSDTETQYLSMMQHYACQVYFLNSVLLEVSLINSGKSKINITEFCLNSMLENIVACFQTMYRSEKIDLLCFFDDERSIVKADKEKLEMILMIIIIYFMKESHDSMLYFGYEYDKQEKQLIFYIKNFESLKSTEELYVFTDVSRKVTNSPKYNEIAIAELIARQLDIDLFLYTKKQSSVFYFRYIDENQFI